MPGESSSAANASAQKDTTVGVDPESPQDGSNDNNHVERISSLQAADKSFKKPGGPMVQSEKIEVEVVPVASKLNPRGTRKASKKTPVEPKVPKGKKHAASPVLPPASPVYRKREREPSPINMDIDDEVEETSVSKKANVENEEIEVEEIEEEVDVEDEEIEVEEVVEEIEERVGDYEEALDVEDKEIEVEEVVEEIEEEVSDYEVLYIEISDDEDGDKDRVDQTVATVRAQVGLFDEAQASSSESASSDSYSGSDEDSDSDSGNDEDTGSSEWDDI